jgi:hypothetical protein
MSNEIRKVRHKFLGRHRWSDWSEPVERSSQFVFGGHDQQRVCTVCGYVQRRMV